jgi:hypothetical protein
MTHFLTWFLIRMEFFIEGIACNIMEEMCLLHNIAFLSVESILQPDFVEQVDFITSFFL